MTNSKAKALEKLVAELQEYKRMADELAETINALTDQVKAEMGDEEMLLVGPFKILWKPVTQNRIDTTALKKQMPEIAERFMKSITVRPLRIS